ncbi:MAG: cache domain-containing protein [Deltaproteobacteria bacterium]|nr:cache domain-containing protein [Deltaproteobacteria bacterium]
MSWKRTIRFRLSMGFIAIILVANSLLSLAAVLYIGDIWAAEVQTRVRLDLNSAWAVYNNRIESLGDMLAILARHRDLADRELDAGSLRDRLGSKLEEIQRDAGMDILSVLDTRGRVLFRASRPEQAGDDLSGNPLVRRALAQKKEVAGTLIASRDDLEREGGSLAERARLDLIDTPAARPSDRRQNTEGMLQGVVVPVFGPEGKPIRFLYAASLLNRSTYIVDTIRDEVFQNEMYAGKYIGTATIFQQDLRISTNVPTVAGERALGTRLSAEVYEKVLEQGKIWADRAFVVNDWYITAYSPIYDPGDRIIGALYVGLLEEPYLKSRHVLVWVLLAMVSVTTLGVLLLLFFVTKLILKPVGHIIQMSRRVIEGDLGARVGIRPSGEMGLLCQTVDQMADAVAQREEQLEQATREQIGQSEKLASIGRLAAGVAHEINNPLTGVMTFAHLLRAKPNMDHQDQEDLDLIVRETTRVREIVRGLLDFARESPSRMQLMAVQEVLANTMTLLRAQKTFNKVEICQEHPPDLPQVCGDRNQLQQVFVNLALNACEAMPDGGRLEIRSAVDGGEIVITFTDTGCGIKAEHLQSIFDPFFTTKPVGKGTGLGLSVSYGIVQQHGGSLEVDSVEGEGTTFTVRLPVCANGVCEFDGAGVSEKEGQRDE